MLLDSLIIQLAINGKNIRANVANDIEQLIKKLWKLDSNTENTLDGCESISIETKYFHPTIAMNFNLVDLSRNLCDNSANVRTATVKRLIKFMNSNKHFTNQMHFLLRSLLLTSNGLASIEIWREILNLLLENVRINSNVSYDTIYFMLYLLAKETDGPKQIELLRGLTSFATAKENIPLILNTYRSLSLSSMPVLRVLSVDLHTRLWLAESRTYQFLHKVLIADGVQLSKTSKWEMNVVKANAIKTICSEK